MKINQISPYFKIEQNQLQVSAVSLDQICKQYSPPFYLYDANTIKSKYQYLRAHLPEQVKIFYAVKANPALAVIDLLKKQGAGAEIASLGELKACLKAGIKPDQIIFAGPGKKESELAEAIGLGLKSINVESMNEIERIDLISQKMNKITPISLRINPQFEVEGAIVNMGGGAKKFGIDSETIKPVIKKCQSLKGIKIIGIHIYSASGMTDQKSFLANIENCFKIADQVNQYQKITSINVGGGIGIPYSDQENEISLHSLNEKLTAMIDRYSFIRENQAGIIVEPGRYLTAQSGIYISQVIDLKQSRGKNFLILQGGINHLIRPAFFRINHPTYNVSRPGSKADTLFTIGGPLCTSTDIIAHNIYLPAQTKINDYIGVFCSGAYCYSVSSLLFLSHAWPAEILIDEEQVLLIRDSISMEHFFNFQHIPH